MNDYFGAPRTGVILAADLADEEANCRLLDQVRDYVDVVKIGSPLVYAAGMGVIRRLRERFGLPVFADLKVADVPHTNAKIVEQVAEEGGSAVMVHGIVGPDGLETCLEASGGRVGIIVQLELTNPGGILFTQPIAEDIACCAAMLDIYGVQAPGNRPERIRRIREIVGPDRVIVCCGVGYQGGSYGAVLDAGGTYAIVGRSIYQAPDPRAAAEGLVVART